MRILILILIFSVCMFSLTANSYAGLEVCNRSADGEVYLAVAYQKGNTWVSQGWWTIHRGECIQAIDHKLRNQFYYYHVQHPEGNYGGNHYFCAHDTEPFLYRDAKRCAKSEMKAFRELNVENAANFSLSLTRKRSGKDQ